STSSPSPPWPKVVSRQIHPEFPLIRCSATGRLRGQAIGSRKIVLLGKSPKSRALAVESDREPLVLIHSARAGELFEPLCKLRTRFGSHVWTRFQLREQLRNIASASARFSIILYMRTSPSHASRSRTSAARAIACKEPRHRWHLRQRWHCGIRNLQRGKGCCG